MEELCFPRIGERCYQARLKCGLPVFVVPKDEFKKCYAFFATHYGGMDLHYQLDGRWVDTPAGVAHFLEHKMFDTKDGNALQELAANGASPNAFTSSSMTGYYFECTDKWEENLRQLLSFVSVPWFTQESVEKEQGIIGQEIAMIEDSPDWRVYNDLLRCLYDHHPIRTSVAGSAESIRQITAETLYDCHKAFYHPGNMVLCVAGNVDAERVCRIGEEILTAPGGGPVARDYGPPEGKRAAQQSFTRAMEVASPVFLVGFKRDAAAPGAGGLRDQLLGDLAGELLLGESSALYGKLYEEGLINKNFGVSYETEPGACFLMAGGESRDPEQVRDRILMEGRRVLQTGVDRARFDRVKRAAYGSRVRALNSFEHICIRMAQGYFAGFQMLTFPEAYDSISLGDVEGFLRELISDEQVSMTQIVPQTAR